MATIKTTLSLNDRMSKAFVNITTAMKSSLDVMKSIKSENIGDAFNKAAADINRAERAVEEFNNTVKNQDEQNKNSNISLKSLLGTYLSFKSIQGIMNQSDILSNTRARLNLIKQEGESVDDLSDKIYQSAQRARTSYQSTADIITKLGMQAGDAFNNSTDQIIVFSELLNKTFTTSGLDATSIESVMYNLTQSLSSGALLGNDYRILKQNAPKMIQIIQDYFGVTRAELDDMVSKGQVTAESIKKAMFGAADEINKEFEQMPMTFSQAWTMFKNSALKAFEPILLALSNVLQGFTDFFNFLSENQYIFYVIAAGAAALAVVYGILNAQAIKTAISQFVLNSAMLLCPATWIIIALMAVAGVLLYLWNTNDEAAEGMLKTWDYFLNGLEMFGYYFKSIFYTIQNFIESISVKILQNFEDTINGAIDFLNGLIRALNTIPGVTIPEIDYQVTIGQKAAEAQARKQAARQADLDSTLNQIYSNALERENTRADRLANRKKTTQEALNTFTSDQLSKLIGTDSTGASALKTTTNDSLLSDEDVQLLLDVATRDYKLNYQQMTPNVTLTFGDVMQTADIDEVMDELANRLDDVYYSNLEVVE